jgi:hypothetical protein
MSACMGVCAPVRAYDSVPRERAGEYMRIYSHSNYMSMVVFNTHVRMFERVYSHNSSRALTHTHTHTWRTLLQCSIAFPRSL